MDVVDRLNEGVSASHGGSTIESFLQMDLMRSRMETRWDGASGKLKVYRVEIRKCPTTGLELQGSFPMAEMRRG
jgi:hypothetical protein